MDRTKPLVVALWLASLALPAAAKDPRPTKHAPPSRKAAPWTIPNAQALVTKGKLPPFFDPTDLARLPVLSVPSAILIDADSGRTLYEKNADVRRPVASTTKIMTGLLLVENTRPEDIITCTNPAITRIEESSLHIKPWEKFTAENLLYGFMLRSGNDAGVVIAEHVAGSVAAFADLMNRRAAEIGCNDTHFVNPHGLTEPNHYSTARDLARIAAVAMRNPRFAEAVRLPAREIERSINKEDSRIVSRMKRRFHEKFPGADGIKTGNTRAAGFCYVGSATRDGHRLISVVLGARGGSSIDDTVALQSWGFRRFGSLVLASEGQGVGSVPVTGGVLPTVLAVTTADLKTVTDRLLPGGTDVTTAFVAEPREIPAPVRAGTPVGKFVAMRGSMVVAEVPAVAASDVPAGALQTASRVARDGFLATVRHPAVLVMGSAILCLVLWRTYARTFTKGAGRRRNRVAPSGGGDDRGGSGSSRRRNRYTTGSAG
ncbi:MAG: D-alanyl-D-alanine carboxypeptidase family protein [Capsulimonadales bacterium]|nr:D-alanyl-D-alanine carboxypeptidase family protein [Capsulimonadales bacterium]